jgi:hypothetical protein
VFDGVASSTRLERNAGSTILVPTTPPGDEAVTDHSPTRALANRIKSEPSKPWGRACTCFFFVQNLAILKLYFVMKH